MITGGEMWVTYDNVKGKRSSTRGKILFHSSSVVVESQRDDANGGPARTDGQEDFDLCLARLVKYLWNTQQIRGDQLWPIGFLSYQDNARIHTSLLSRQKLW